MTDQQRSQKGQQIPDLSEEDARVFFEAQCWPDGPVCPHCGSHDHIAQNGKGVRPGLYYCRSCRGQYSVTVGTVMEDTHLPLATWAKAFHYMASSKKGVSALFLMRALGLGSYRTAWFLAHRVRLAMTPKADATETPLEGIVEVDETYVGGKARGKGHANAFKNKTPVVSLVERNGRKRSVVMPRVTAQNLRETIAMNTAESAEIHTDSSRMYLYVKGRNKHRKVNHDRKEYVRIAKDGTTVTTNTVEASFALLKRGIMGQFHSVSRKHLHRYVAEFDLRWNERHLSDAERRDVIIKGAKGKRLTYRAPIQGESS